MSSLPPAEDDERTLLPGKVPPPGDAVDRSAGDEYAQDALPNGTRLGEFEITAPIGQGGFSMVYLVYDHSLQRKVALKEYMPSSFAARVGEVTVAARSERHAETFAAGLRSFINEARLLAQFDHPSLLKVHRFWEANGTGYMVMPFYEGLTLKQALSQHDTRPSEMWIKNLLRQLLDALEVLHRASPPCLHRDISPDNILLLKDDHPLLLDFGAARRVISDAQALTVVLKPGYAPMEQYAEEPSIKQGPWTDIYALAAVVYFAVTGRPPMPSVTRLVSDTLVPLSKACAGRYSPEFLKAIDTALSVNPKGRPQSVAEFRQLLGFGKPVETPTVMFGHDRSTGSSSGAEPDAPRRRWLLPAIGGVVAVAIIGAAVWWGVSERDKIVSAASKPPTVAPPPDVPAQAAPPVTPPPAVPAPDIAQKQPAGGTTAPSGSSPAVPPVTPAPAVLQPPPPYDPLNALAEVYQARNPQHMVTVAVDKTQVNFKKKEPIGFTVTSSQPGYVYILVVGVDSALSLLFPNPQDRNNRISADIPLTLPRDTWTLNPVGPRGTDHFLVIVSDSERDFTAAGMRTAKSGKYGYGDFPLEVIAPLYRSHTGTAPLFAGKAKCAAGARSCSESYGAAQFSVEEVDR